MTAASPPRLGRSARVALLLVALAGVGEAALHFLDDGPGPTRLVSDDTLHHVHPRSQSFRTTTPGSPGRFHWIHYDDDGLVSRTAREEVAAASPCRIAFLGDSQTEAGQVAYDSSFAGRLAQRAAACTTRNFGVSSYSPLIYLVQWQVQVAQFSPTHLFVQLSDDDFDADVAMTAQAVRDEHGNIVAIPGRNPSALRTLLLRSEIARFAARALRWRFRARAPARDNQQLSASYMKQLIARSGDAGARITLLAVSLPSGDAPAAAFWRDWAAGQGVDYVDITARLAAASCPAFLPADPHLSACGHALVAQAVAAVHPELFPAPAPLRHSPGDPPEPGISGS